MTLKKCFYIVGMFINGIIKAMIKGLLCLCFIVLWILLSNRRVESDRTSFYVGILAIAVSSGVLRAVFVFRGTKKIPELSLINFGILVTLLHLAKDIVQTPDLSEIGAGNSPPYIICIVVYYIPSLNRCYSRVMETKTLNDMPWYLVEVGTFIYGLMNALLNGTGSIIVIILLTYYETEFDKISLFYLRIAIMVTVSGFLFAVLLIIGVSKKIPAFVLTYFIFEVTLIAFIGYTIFQSLDVYKIIKAEDAIICGLVLILLNGLPLILVFKTYKNMSLTARKAKIKQNSNQHLKI